MCGMMCTLGKADPDTGSMGSHKYNVEGKAAGARNSDENNDAEICTERDPELFAPEPLQ